MSFDWIRKKDPSIALGPASIAASIVDHGLPVQLLTYDVSTQPPSPDGVVKDIQDCVDAYKSVGMATDVALGAFVWNEGLVNAVMERLKEQCGNTRIVLGGPQVSYAPSGVLELAYPWADVFVRGYGEVPLTMLLQGCPPCDVPGIHVKGEKDSRTTAEVDLDLLPSPFLSGIIQPNRFIRWETKRGCPQRCAFCQHRESDFIPLTNPQLNEDRVLREANWISSNGMTDDLAVLDPTFNTGLMYLDVLKELRASRYDGKISLQCKGDSVTMEFVEAMALLGEGGANVVPEFGLQTIHKPEQLAIRRRDNLKKFYEVMRKLSGCGIQFEISLIFGLPQQTVESFKESVDFSLELAANGKGIVRAFPLMLLRGTELDSRPTRCKWGLKESFDESITGFKDSMRYVIESNTFSYEEWLQMREISEFLISTEGDHPKSL